MEDYTRHLGELAASWVPSDRRVSDQLARRAVIDTVAVSLAALDDPTVTTALRALGPGNGGPATVLATGQSGDPGHAALLGGLLGHALDYDDVDDAMIGHPSTVLVPALLAVAEELDVAGDAVLDAFALGLHVCRDVAARVGIEAHYAKGWHSTGTVGTIGATAALSRLRRLDVGATRHALGIAGSLAGGSRQNFGTMTKPLHAGVAAHNAVLATRLAAAGFTADPDQLESPLGFLALHHGAGSGSAPDATTQDGLNVKLYPCCYYIHSAADAVLELVGAGVRAEDVERLRVTVQPGGLGPLIHTRPATGLQGKFSMEYAMAAAVLDRQLTLATFTDEQVQRPAVQQLLQRVETTESVVPPAGGDADGAFAVVEVDVRSGGRLQRRVDRPRGHATRSVTDDELHVKFADCAAYAGLHPEETEPIHELLSQLGPSRSVRASVRPLRELVRRRAAAGTTG
ncbi:MmgE/PrpD family protein [Serinicoccus sp. LYQ131]|uniref:MmgE/PrpD family protein n=1 Tax=Serinicoccus sp. LYQ131 TaxID=3378797 RepID=UPI003853B074